MAQLSITLNQEEILLLVAENPTATFKNLLESRLSGLLKIEAF